MRLIFEKNTISINGITCDLDSFDEKKLFSIMETIINNKDIIEIEKTNDATPLATKFYEMINNAINEKDDDLE